MTFRIRDENISMRQHRFGNSSSVSPGDDSERARRAGGERISLRGEGERSKFVVCAVDLDLERHKSFAFSVIVII